MLIAGFNLASTDYRRARRQVILAAAVGAALGVLLVGQLGAWLALRREVGAIGHRLASMEREVRRHQEDLRAVRAGLPPEAIKRYEARVAAYNQILEASAFSWMGLLVELERSVPPFVFLKEIHPDLTTRQVKLSGVARAFDDLGLFLRGLEERTVFRDVYLLRQTDRKASAGGEGGLEFAVNLTYRGRGQ